MLKAHYHEPNCLQTEKIMNQTISSHSKTSTKIRSWENPEFPSHKQKHFWPFFWHFFDQPSTLNPQPLTLDPQPSTLNPQPSTLNPQPSTLFPLYSTPYPQQSTLIPHPSSLNPWPSFLSPQVDCSWNRTWTLNPHCQPSQPLTLNPQPLLLKTLKTNTKNELPSINHWPSSFDPQPTTLQPWT